MTSARPSQSLFPTLPVGLGAYTLTQLLGSHGRSDFYIARQSHVERRVVLEVLHPAAPEDGENAASLFLATARARGAVRLPRVASVLESSVSPEGYAYICQDLPEGTPLSDLAAEGRQLSPQQVCALVSAVAKLYEAAAAAGLAAAPFSADMIFINRAGSFNFLSPVQNGTPTEGDCARQLQALAKAVLPVQPVNVPGQGRIATLLGWMQHGYEGEALDWAATANTAGLIAEQLNPEAILHLNRPKHYDRGREQRAGKRRRRQVQRRVALIGTALLVILAMGAAGLWFAPQSVPAIPPLQEGYVHANVEGKMLRVAARPVSIAEYRQFLDDYASMDASRRGSLSQNVPPAESDPTPGDWAAQFQSAAQEAPVTHVSYWQALMYARYKRASLPGATLLSAARAEAGLPGIEEWTQDEQAAAAPYTPCRIVLPAAEGASPIPENNPAMRSPQRGFRICP